MTPAQYRATLRYYLMAFETMQPTDDGVIELDEITAVGWLLRMHGGVAGAINNIPDGDWWEAARRRLATLVVAEPGA